MNLIGGRKALAEKIPAMQSAACEKKISVECDTLEQALQAAQAGSDLIQFDKVAVATLQDSVSIKKPISGAANRDCRWRESAKCSRLRAIWRGRHCAKFGLSRQTGRFGCHH
ncbi:hypothetical protein THIOSC15_3230003 [uncultured Thiomicrorhabdus sp.]